MGQGDVLELLEKAKKELDSTELCKKLKQSRNTINKNLKALLKQGLIKFRDTKWPFHRNWSAKGKKFKIEGENPPRMRY